MSERKSCMRIIVFLPMCVVLILVVLVFAVAQSNFFDGWFDSNEDPMFQSDSGMLETGALAEYFGLDEEPKPNLISVVDNLSECNQLIARKYHKYEIDGVSVEGLPGQYRCINVAYQVQRNRGLLRPLIGDVTFTTEKNDFSVFTQLWKTSLYNPEIMTDFIQYEITDELVQYYLDQAADSYAIDPSLVYVSFDHVEVSIYREDELLGTFDAPTVEE